MLRECLAVALGGMTGSLARYFLVVLFSFIGCSWLPIATLIANVAGCFAIGWLVQWSMACNLDNHWAVTGVRVGLLGGLTTFSSFALDVVRYQQSDRTGLSIALVAAHVGLGLAAVLAGLWWAKPVLQP